MKKKIGQGLFIAFVAALLIVGLSYGSTLLFFQLHHMPLEAARPFLIWDYWTTYRQSPDKFLRISVNVCAFLPYILLLLAPVLLLLGKKQRALHGDARFATLAEVRKAGLIDPPKGLDKTILVGKFKGHYLTYGGYQFVMLAAPTRSGKGVGVVIPNCLNYSDSLVVLDIKLENFDITAGFRAAHGQEVYLFCPFDTKGRTHRYNPLEYISSDPAERIGDIDAIGTALYSGGNENDKFWSENAKDLFRGLCLMVLENPKLPKTLGEILRQASGKGKPFAEHVEDMLKEAEDEGRPYSNACQDALNRIINNSENTLAGIVSTFNGPLLIFQNPRVDLATSANDFDLREVRRKKMTIYLGVTPDKLKDAAVIVNLFFDQLLNLNTRVLPQQDKSLKYQCLLILDEFTAIGKVAMIQQSISYQAGYNMRVLTIIQNKSQLEDKYGKSGALTLMANHALMIMYAPSPVVQSDANEYSEMLGYQTVKSKNKSRSFAGNLGGSGSRSESESDQRRALMLPQELKELGQWREIVSLENCKPILCDKIKYFEDPAFTQRTNWETPPIPVQDVDTFVAKIEDRRRDLTAADADLAAQDLAAKTVGLNEAPDLPDVTDLTDAELNDVLDEVAQGFVKAVVKEPLDLEKFRMEKEQAEAAAQSIFGGDDGGEEGFDLVNESAAALTAETESSNDEEQETANMLAMFAGEDAGAQAPATADQSIADESKDISTTKEKEQSDELDRLSNTAISQRCEGAEADIGAGERENADDCTETAATKEQEKSAVNQEDLSALTAMIDEQNTEPENTEKPEDELLAQLGFDDEAPADEAKELTAGEKEILGSLGLAEQNAPETVEVKGDLNE